MEDDSGVKAPVTRLRRSLSVEQSEESKSPAPNTPTKARRGRRKPELELIEENSAAKTTPLKTVTKDIVEEEKPLTPSRRSARIRSNTSIVSETAVVDSPRAKRAARRLSQVGSDTEGPATPVRQTRRTRKDSTSSIDKAENQVAAKQKTIPEPITEENEANKQQPVPNTSDETNDNNKPVRKSLRLQEKKARKSKTSQSPEKSIDEDLNKSKNNVTLETKDSESTEVSDNQAPKTNDLITISPVKGSGRLSIGSAELLESVNVKPSKKTSSLNKSTSALSNLISESRRPRSKSCSVYLSVAANDDIINQFYSDSESTKKRKSNSRTPLKQLNISGSNKSLNKSSMKEKSFTEIPKNEATESVMQLNISGSNKSLNKSSNKETSFTEFSKNEATEKDQSDNSNDIHDIFKQKPSSDMQVTIIFEDSDSNPKKLNRAEDDQCVPEINETKEDNSTARKNSINDSCEPMDIDETIPDHLLIDHSQKINDKSMQSPQKSKRKSSFGLNLDASENHNKSNSSGFAIESDKQNISSSEANTSKQNTSLQSSKESKRKSSINQSFNESENQNRSTLVLSHLKDISESETNKSTKSPQQLNDKRLSNSTTVLNITHENIVSNKNLSLCYSTSTPLQQKGNRGIKVNTSNIKSPGENKLIVSKTKNSDSDSDSSESNKAKGNESKLIKQKSDSSSSDGESSQEKNDLMDDEVEDAGDDYESGDSQDEEEIEEALANEIREKGETLTSEEELSDDSDYEKDSFIVRSAEEDNELLEGTEDDLSMSDNELNMSKKSKQKFNERKLKAQKKASREMFESRHQINNSKTEKKKKRIQLNSSSESEDDEVKKPSKAKTRQILISSADITSNSQGNVLSIRKSQSMRSSESDYEDIKPLKTKNKQRLDSEDMNVSKEDSIKLPKRNKTPSQSICNESIVENNEKEISFNVDQVENERDPLSQSIKKEPKTPLKENMSLAFIDAQNANMSIKESDKLDPLASTIANNEDDDEVDSSMSSDNERIVQDYDSILEGLNKANKIKSVDTSLNFEKRTKKKDKEPIVDHLNLTQVKGKKSKNKMEVPKNDKSKENRVLPLDKDESSSDSKSALMNLLFSEESNHCDDANTKNEDDSNNYISLKRVGGKTDIHDCGPQENEQSNKTPQDKKKKNRTLSESSFTKKSDAYDFLMDKSTTKTPKSDKKKQKKISESQETDINSEDGGLPFFIDTEGANAQNTSVGNKSLNKSKTSVSEKDNDSDSDAPMEVSFKKDRNLSNSKMDNLDEGSSNISSSIGSSKKKKKQNINSSNIEIKVTSDSEKTESAKKKNKKISISLNESITATEKDTIESTETLNVKTPGSGKKIRKNSNVDTKDEIDAAELTINKSISKTPSSDKKKSKKSIDVASEETSVLDTSLITSNGKKKEKKFSEKSQNDAYDFLMDKSTTKTPKSDKKKQKKISESQETDINSEDGGLPFFIDTEGANAQNTSVGNKSLNKSKTSVSERDNDSDSDAPMEVSFKKDRNLSNSKMVNLDEGSSNISSSIGSSKKKKKQNINSSNIEIKVTSDSEKTESAKKKNKKISISLNESITATEKDTIESTETLNVKTPGSGKKIRKNSNVDTKDEIDAAELTINKSISKTPSSDKKKSKKSIDVASEETSVLDTSLITSNGKKKEKKFSEKSQNDAYDFLMDKSTTKTPKSDKKKQKKISESQETDINSEDGGLPFFIDTEGANAQNTSVGNKSLNKSKTSVSERDNDSDSDAPMEVSFKKDRNLSNSKMVNLDEGSSNISSSIGSSKKKKKQNINSSNIEIKVTSDSEKTESAKKKNKKISISLNESITATEKDTIESTETLNVKTPGSGKKIRKNSNVDTKDEIDAAELTINKSISKTPSSDKKKSKKSIDVASEETSVLDTSLITSNGKKKEKKFSEKSQNDIEIPPIPEQPESAKKIENNDTENKNNPEGESRKLTKAEKRKRKRSSLVSEEEQKDPNEKEALHLNKHKKAKLTPQGMMETEKNLTELIKGTKSKKRKEREDDNIEIIQPTKESSLKKVQVSRLPTSVLEQLDDKPRQEEPKRKKSKLTATTDFIVEETKIRKNKPSMFLEETICLNEDEKELKKQKAKSLKPKVLPFVPTASTSISGYTTNFKVNVIPRDTKFVAQSNDVTNFKSEYLYGKKIKRHGTYEMYKRSRNVKLSKF